MKNLDLTGGSTIHTDAEALEILKLELEKGIESMKKGQVFTIEEAWKEIDKI